MGQRFSRDRARFGSDARYLRNSRLDRLAIQPSHRVKSVTDSDKNTNKMPASIFPVTPQSWFHENIFLARDKYSTKCYKIWDSSYLESKRNCYKRKS